jgi:hypothetical protein
MCVSTALLSPTMTQKLRGALSAIVTDAIREMQRGTPFGVAVAIQR